MNEPLDFKPATRPGDVALTGRYGSVVKLDPLQHKAALWHAIEDPRSSIVNGLPAKPHSNGGSRLTISTRKVTKKRDCRI